MTDEICGTWFDAARCPHDRNFRDWRKTEGKSIINKLILGAFALTMISGASFAEDSTTANPNPSVFDKHDTMAPFYSDTDMKTLKTGDELKAAWMAMSKEDQDAVKEGCGDEAIAKEHDNFCANTKDLRGAN